jgi:heme/copper-type cytochrome/quinol oxidase subunit 3
VILRSLVVSAIALTFGMGWGAVWELEKLRRKPPPDMKPAPAWVNVTTMLGITFILLGVGYHSWTHLRAPATFATASFLAGVAFLMVGTAGLLRTFGSQLPKDDD